VRMRAVAFTPPPPTERSYGRESDAKEGRLVGRARTRGPAALALRAPESKGSPFIIQLILCKSAGRGSGGGLVLAWCVESVSVCCVEANISRCSC